MPKKTAKLLLSIFRPHGKHKDSCYFVKLYSKITSRCGPCKTAAPFFADFSEKFPDLVFLKVDVDDLPGVTKKENITCMPTFKIYKNGALFAEVKGANTDKLHDKIKEAQ